MDMYQVVPESLSCHCCFKYTVVDTTRAWMDDRPAEEGNYYQLCECFFKEDADHIVRALNYEVV